MGVWLSEDLDFDYNTREICRRAYSRLSMITKLKYADLPTEELLHIYTLFIRSITEYCSVVFHSSLTQQQSRSLENIQRVCLKVILDVNYVSYIAALEMCGLSKLSERRETRCLTFSLRCLKNPHTSDLFPLCDTDKYGHHNVRGREKYKVNFARTETYKNSSVIHCRRKLNEHFAKKIP